MSGATEGCGVQRAPHFCGLYPAGGGVQRNSHCDFSTWKFCFLCSLLLQWHWKFDIQTTCCPVKIKQEQVWVAGHWVSL